MFDGSLVLRLKALNFLRWREIVHALATTLTARRNNEPSIDLAQSYHATNADKLEGVDSEAPADIRVVCFKYDYDQEEAGNAAGAPLSEHIPPLES
jgi:hypothetical protein